MKLEAIGFYTLSDYRAKNISLTSPLWRCELVLGPKCNFHCTYCRGIRKDYARTLPVKEALSTLKLWCSMGLKNVRFSGGEPTLYKGLIKLVKYCKAHKVERIAVSTNGSADWSLYEELISAGVNDFSVSLDSCCSAVGDKMAGGNGSWFKVVGNIGRLAKKIYTTVGIVINQDNIEQCLDTVIFADSLSVADIRVIPSAQYNRLLDNLDQLPARILSKYPILRYRVNNIRTGKNIRGLTRKDSKHCWLAMDDMAVANNYHFPCIIYMRERGDPIGKVGPNMRQERYDWALKHDCFKDLICKKNCLDVCIFLNNKIQSERQ
jgi:molybdenum cofactor biosynthesis enzyme MoaA